MESWKNIQIKYCIKIICFERRCEPLQLKQKMRETSEIEIKSSVVDMATEDIKDLHNFDISQSISIV